MYNLITKNDLVLYITEDEINLPSMNATITFVQQPFNSEVTVGGGDVNTDSCIVKTTNESIPLGFVGTKYKYTTTFELNEAYIELIDEE